ncbi:isochorismatase family protein [Streptomyces sp. NRRL S-448]|uniref:isochorismatase family protein n=1 Tax=Streptomyces sp. NRRL S-448 TaxID=1463907 RepID=UPI003565B1E2
MHLRQFHGGEVMLGLLYTAPAVGAVAVSATSGWLTRAARPGRLLIIAAFTGGLSAVGFGLSGNIWAACALLAVGGAAGTVYEILECALVQHSTPDRLRGRIVSVITTQGTTGGVVGDVEVAALARWFSPGGAAVVNGAVCAVAALAVAVAVPGLRRATLPRDGRDESEDDGPGPDTAGLAPGPDDTVLTKWKYSAFVRTDLLERLRARGRDQLVITGVYAHIGVLMTVCDAWMQDVQAFVVADAVADFSAREHRMALEWAAGRCAVVTTAGRVCAQL